MSSEANGSKDLKTLKLLGWVVIVAVIVAALVMGRN